jgi:energy-coupling factor transporter transmembrane protein EcfT
VAAVFVARGIGRGSEFARFLVSLVMIVRIVGDIFLVAQYGDRFLWLPIFWALWSLLVLFLLWNSRASRFFDPQ